MEEIERLLARQDGVIARRQAIEAGCSPATVRRLLRRREWNVLHPGVYVDHTGQPSWHQRAWAAVLLHWPAALDGRSALRAHEGGAHRQPDDGSPIEVVVPHDRHPRPAPGVRVRRSRRFSDSVRLDLHPPRQRFDDAVLELADRSPDELRAIAVLADACGARRTTASRRRSRLGDIGRLTRRAWLDAVLARGATVRLGWGQVIGRPCSTAAKLAVLLQHQGWPGSPVRCPDCPPPGDGVAP